MSSRRYRTAYGMAKFAEVFGWIVLVGGIITGIAIATQVEILGVVIALGCLFGGLAIVFYSQLILVVIDTENNTHQIALELTKTNAMLAETLGSICANVKRIAGKTD